MRRRTRREKAAPPARPSPDRSAWIGLALVVLVAAVFAEVRHFAFISLDDPDYVTNNPHVTAGLRWTSIAWAFTAGHAANWHPLTWLSHMLDVELFGVDAGAHHVVNALFHGANTLVLFLLLRRMTGAAWPSAVVAALFAVHPLHVESVAWVAERKDVLSTLCWLLATWAYVRWVRAPHARRYLAVAALFALGLMAKPMLVTLPITLLLFDVWPLGRLAALSAVTLVKEKLPLLALAAASSIVTFVVQQRGGAVSDFVAYPAWLRVQNAAVSAVAYLRDTVWPVDLTLFYPYPSSLPVFVVASSAATLAAVTALAWRVRHAHPYVAAGWAWYLVTLAPVIGLIQVGSQARADRYSYVPLIGVFIAIVWGFAALASRIRVPRIATAATATAVIVGLAVVARGQVAHWRDDVTVWRRAVTATLGSHQHGARLALGKALMARGQAAEAIVHFSEAVRLEPANASYHTSLGLAFVADGRMDDAVAAFEAAVRLEPASGAVRRDLGLILSAEGRTDEALAAFREAVRLDPALADAQHRLGLILARRGDLDGAVTALTAAMAAAPDFAEARTDLGTALAGLGRIDEAIAAHQAAIRIRPDLAEAHNNLGLALTAAGRHDEALARFEDAVRLKPDLAPARRNLGRALAGRRRFDDALTQYREALRLDPSDRATRDAVSALERLRAGKGGG